VRESVFEVLAAVSSHLDTVFWYSFFAASSAPSRYAFRLNPESENE
jgi:hypothetical protein